VSGENKVVDDQVRLLREAGHDVARFSPAPTGLGGLELARTGARSIWNHSATQQVSRIVRDQEIEVVHVHNLFPELSPAVIRAARSEGASVVMTLHNYRLSCLPATLLREGEICELCVGGSLANGVRYHCYRDSFAASAALAAALTTHRVLRTFDSISLFIAPSSFVAAKHAEMGIDPDRIRVVPHFAWPSEVGAGPRNYFLYLGRLSKEKGVDVLLSAWRGSTSPLLVAGDGPDREELVSMAPPSVEFIGQVESGQVPSLLSGARALIVPSIWYETFGLVIAEAAAAGVPTIASSIGALAEVVAHEVSGLLIPPGDTLALRRAVDRLLDESERTRLSSGAVNRWRLRYSPEVTVSGLESVYREATARGTSRVFGGPPQ
jgi:glycosyltransferase involved in cell wall biosynthesis